MRNDEAEHYAVGLLGEEGCEIGVLAGKATRFGIDARGPKGPPYHASNVRELMPMECGDILAAIDYAVAAGLLDRADVEAYRKTKLAKLLDPEARTDDGRRLAPPVYPEWQPPYKQPREESAQ